MSKKTIYTVYIALVLFTVAPILSVLVASGIATLGDCPVNEGGVNSCVVVGIEFGEVLYTMFVSGWFALMTLPLGIGALILWSIIVAIKAFRTRAHKKESVETPNETLE